jgi:ABC-type multidrug transport system ATPase subunit
MKIMYGVSPPTAGEAFIFGMNVRTQMGEIRKILGVCPQFDILFSDMSAKEHIELFCGIKGIARTEMLQVMEERLKHMKLWNVRDQRAGQYSGGMKRRLSVILSTLGDPECVFLGKCATQI